jgi:hypothetical protein
MAQHRADDGGVGAGSDEAQRPAPTRRATLHGEGADALQQTRFSRRAHPQRGEALPASEVAGPLCVLRDYG